ncbi:MBL fold metallo-hydrolase [Nocardioides sp. ChNu-153]|uniref:MBL fold metallo-hydrolase n=1 Tax=unclassified Nocardioides TaxID=2615069 RepID=UPI002405EDC0|nr:MULTISPECIES: MBL fold metallo-hydrolase [unclassified Nocardioides]MDF9716754.1 MBL fold metallo-hydrolase [Nocardioides sp. ChNu-99]MDN7121966.1 MBL fold metallo-hydrolase [Nocardioides sp. ChNu-153]
MRITKFGHACVRISEGGSSVVVDPGAFTEREAVEGATAVLVTHEHADHLDVEHLRATDAPIWTIGAVARAIASQAPDVAERVVVVAPGEAFDASGVAVRAVGEKHAVIHPDYDRFDNSGYLLEVGGRRVFHPGDALTGPGEPVDVLLAPVSAPWLRIGDAVDFAREVGAPTSLAIHDRVYSDLGLGMADQHFRALLGEGQEWVRLPDGADLP